MVPFASSWSADSFCLSFFVCFLGIRLYTVAAFRKALSKDAAIGRSINVDILRGVPQKKLSFPIIMAAQTRLVCVCVCVCVGEWVCACVCLCG